ncbi:chitin deacetylase 8-like [Onthophagus taurus]|uniref:chitin deacetylase 8-like n=1 Tax=Onthophagus taurus TaxID=166361 RepID=UPI0039BDA4A9
MKVHLLIACIIAAVSADTRAAEPCSSAVCKIEDTCRCSGSTPPITLADVPQLITLAFNDAVTDVIYTTYLVEILKRTNRDGVQIGASFYVPHEYSDYARVVDLYNKGMDIGVHSISKNPESDYWKQASEDTLYDEFFGQREILNAFAGIPIEEIVGGRTPGFEINGDRTFRAYERAGILYDNSWVLRSNTRLYPFSLHYKATQPSQIGATPADAFTKTWVLPIIDLIDMANNECNAIAACSIQADSADDVKAWLMEQFKRHYNNNKAPLTLNINAAWFAFSEYNLPGFLAFMDDLRVDYPDVFFVDHKQVIAWMFNPVTSAQFATTVTEKSLTCSNTLCPLYKGTELRYMKTCTYCPDTYPWVGNPLGEF